MLEILNMYVEELEQNKNLKGIVVAKNTNSKIARLNIVIMLTLLVVCVKKMH